MIAIPLERAAWDAAIIDLDGTLVDTLGDFSVALNRMLQDLGACRALGVESENAPRRDPFLPDSPPHSGAMGQEAGEKWAAAAHSQPTIPKSDRLPGLPPIAPAFVATMIGKGSEHLLRSVLKHVLTQVGQAQAAPEIDAQVEALYARAWPSYQRHYAAINGQYAQLYPGALQGVQALHAAGLRLACLTNKPLAFARALLQSKGLAPYFAQVFGGDSFAAKKPDPLPLRKTCEALLSAPARTLVVGDSSNDAQAARAAGCPVVLVTYGYNHGQPARSVPADGYIDSLADLLPLQQ
ncbi:HAD-IA family hydrolase [Extensimonas perlucida]|uniref:HAD-IA family hydrolase n=1 Tax=Extensimonas perlucida TaxID=2590786 RepID=UPI0011AA1995|nr:HAD-IA family hydrolase [Extensimonas perlucida]